MNTHIDWKALSDFQVVEQIGKYMKTMRLNANVSQDEMAERAGISRTSVSNIETGRAVVNMRTLVAYLRVLDRLNSFNGFVTQPTFDLKAMKLNSFMYKTKKRATKK